MKICKAGRIHTFEERTDPPDWYGALAVELAQHLAPSIGHVKHTKGTDSKRTVKKPRYFSADIKGIHHQFGVN
jgi:hypothetical protein